MNGSWRVAAKLGESPAEAWLELAEDRGDRIAIRAGLNDADRDAVVREDPRSACRRWHLDFECVECRLQQFERRGPRLQRCVEKAPDARMELASHVPEACGHAILRHLINPSSCAAATISAAIGPESRAP